jgi:glycosyltransferase involved in cell wall biosynthesis
LSVIVPTKNGIGLLRTALPALAFADEIVVVDEFSPDGTADYVRSLPNARLLERTGLLNENINAGLDASTGDWTMIVDYDEIVTPELAREIRDRIATAPPEIIGYALPSRVYWCGKTLRYGPQYERGVTVPGERYRKRLFRRGAARYACVAIHEDLTTVVPGTWARTENRYDHYTIENVRRWFEKANYYTDREAQLADLAGRTEKRAARDMLWKPLKTFLVFYVKRQGFRDGALGIVACGCYAVSSFMEETKKWERIATAPNAAALSRNVDSALSFVMDDEPKQATAGA